MPSCGVTHGTKMVPSQLFLQRQQGDADPALRYPGQVSSQSFRGLQPQAGHLGLPQFWFASAYIKQTATGRSERLHARGVWGWPILAAPADSFPTCKGCVEGMVALEARSRRRILGCDDSRPAVLHQPRCHQVPATLHVTAWLNVAGGLAAAQLQASHPTLLKWCGHSP